MPGVVTVACKLPHGIKLQCQEPYTVSEPVMGGGIRDMTYYRHTGRTVSIKGWAIKHDEDERPLIVGGYALTHGVDADFFARWREQNADSDLVKGGFILSHEKQDAVSAEAKKHIKPSGFERVTPSSLPSEFKGVIATADVR